MECKDVKELLSVYLDKGLKEARLREVEEHLGICSGCQGEFEGLRRTVELVGSLKEVEPPPGLLEDVKKKIALRSPLKRLADRLSFPRREIPLEVVGLAAALLLIIGPVVYFGIIKAPAPKVEFEAKAPPVKTETPRESEKRYIVRETPGSGPIKRDLYVAKLPAKEAKIFIPEAPKVKEKEEALTMAYSDTQGISEDRCNALKEKKEVLTMALQDESAVKLSRHLESFQLETFKVDISKEEKGWHPVTEVVLLYDPREYSGLSSELLRRKDELRDVITKVLSEATDSDKEGLKAGISERLKGEINRLLKEGTIEEVRLENILH